MTTPIQHGKRFAVQSADEIQFDAKPSVKKEITKILSVITKLKATIRK